MEYNKQHLGSLRDSCDTLLQLSLQIDNLHFDDHDHFGFMSLCFLSKQTDHMDAVLKLYPHPDMQLISRTMIEGLNQLLWCFNEPDRAFQWRGYAWISDWRSSKVRESEGYTVPEEHKKNIDTFISKHGELFKKNRFKNQPIPEDEDPFHPNWRCGKNLKDITDEVGGGELYKKLYSPFSDWQHWGVTSIGHMIKRNSKGVSYGINSNNGDLCSALAVAFQCLFQILELVNAYHKLDMEQELDKVKSEYMTSHATTQQNAGIN